MEIFYEIDFKAHDSENVWHALYLCDTEGVHVYDNEAF